MALAFFVMVKHTLVHKGLVAGHAVELACSFIVVAFVFNMGGISIYACDCSLPAEQTALLPFAVKHLLNLVQYLFFEVNQWLHSLEKIAKVVSQICNIKLVFVLLFQV